MKKFVFVAFLIFGVVSLSADIWINEFCVTPTASEFLELFNDGISDQSLDGYYLIEGGTTWAETLSLTGLTVSASSFLVIDSTLVSGFGLPNEGGWMKIVDDTYAVIDSVGYGNQGAAPAPIYNWSSARMSYTGDLASDFNMDDTPTQGSANDATPANLGNSSVIINEVKADTTTIKGQFVELYNNGSSAVDISDWIIICDDDYYVPSGTSLGAGEYFVLTDADFPGYFYMGANYENLYLFDNNMVRVDQIGWSEAVADSSFSAIPNGTRTVFNGYDSETCTDFQWVTPTEGSANDNSGIIIDNVNNDLSVNVSVNRGIAIFNIKGFEGKTIALNIYDMSGRVVKKLNYFVKGTVKIPFNLNNGVYVYKIAADTQQIMGKFVIVK